MSADHGVMDLFRNEKLAAAVFASQKDPRVPSDIVFQVSPAAGFGDMPAGYPGGMLGLHQRRRGCGCTAGGTSSPSSGPTARAGSQALAHPPIQIDDFVGVLLEKYEGHRPQRGGAAGRLPQRPSGGTPPPLPPCCGPG